MANDRPTRYIIAWGRPTDEYREKNIVSPSIWLLVGTMVHTRTGGTRFFQKKILKKKLKKIKKNSKNLKKNSKNPTAIHIISHGRVQACANGRVVCRYGGISRV